MDAYMASKLLEGIEICEPRSEVGVLKSFGALWPTATD